MTYNPLRDLAELGQSIWYDNIHRTLLEGGELERLVREDGLRGVTSNPTIFDKAISGGDSYDAAIVRLIQEQPDLSVEDIFLHLAVADIRDAADILRPVYEQTGGQDGMVSMEVSPLLAADTEATIREARRLHARVDRPNLMIKVPATPEGLPAIETLISDGINVNVTLIFSVERYREVVRAYLAGLRERAARRLPLDKVTSVASLFVSRIDSAVDPRLDGIHTDIRGRVAVANARTAYRHFLDVFDGNDFNSLRAAGAHEQRLLWASTGTKNPHYSDVLYVEELCGPRTVNTLPPATLDAFRDHGRTRVSLPGDSATDRQVLSRLADAGITLADVMDTLEAEGVKAFADSYGNLLAALETRLARIRAQRRTAI